MTVLGLGDPQLKTHIVGYQILLLFFIGITLS